MFFIILVFGLLDCVLVSYGENHKNDVIATDLIETLKANMNENLDLPKDEEYEDLRAELLAYHEALRTLTEEPDTRRSLKSTPCWRLVGVCVKEHLCKGFPSLTQVPGCKDDEEVCCFVWNKYKTRDMTQFGINNLGLPWHIQSEVGGRGVIMLDAAKNNKSKKKRRLKKENIKKVSELGIEEIPFDRQVEIQTRIEDQSSDDNIPVPPNKGKRNQPLGNFGSNSDKYDNDRPILASKPIVLKSESDDENKAIALLIRSGKKIM